MNLKLYELVDAFILDTCPVIGQTFNKSEFRAWLRKNGWDEIEASDALQAHRQSPKQRVFSTMRHGMGPSSYYSVVEDSNRKQANGTVKAMHRQQTQEMVDRWVNEAIYRMYPLAKTNPAARRVVRSAKAEIRLVAEVLQARLDELDLGDE